MASPNASDDYRDTYDDTGLPLGSVAVGSTSTGNIETSGDDDIFAVTLTAGGRYAFNLDGTDTSSALTLRDPYLRLLDSSGTVLATADDISGTNWGSEIDYTALTSGTYYLQANSSPVDATYTTGTYRVGAVLIQDDYRNTYNDGSVALGNLVVNGGASGVVETLGDKDVFAVKLTGGTVYTFNLDGSDTSASYTLRDPYLRLLDSNGNVLASNDDISSGNWGSQISKYQVGTSGTYYVEASSSPIDQTYTTGTYQVRVAATPDDYADTYTGAYLQLGSVAVGGSASGTIESVGDTDVFAIMLTAGQSYSFDLSGFDSLPFLTLRDPALSLLDGAGNVVASNDDLSATNWGSEIANYTAITGGTYYLVAASSPIDQTYTTGSYSVSAKFADDYGDAYNDTSRPLGQLANLPNSAAGDIETIGDKDVFAVTLTAGKVYNFTLEGYDFSSSYTLRDPYLRLLDSSGNVLVTSDDISSSNWGSQINAYKTLSSGTFYLEASSSPVDSTYTTGTYLLRADPTAINVFQDDYRDTYNDTPSYGRPLGTVAIGGTATGTIELLNDRDVFAVTLSAGVAYTFDVDGSDVSSSYTLRDPSLRLLDSSGNALAASDDVSGTNWSSEIANYVAPTSSTYYLEAASSPIDHTYTTGTYQVRASLGDDYRNTYNDSILPLGTVTPGGSATGNIQTVGDKDVFAVTLTAGNTYTFNLDGSDASSAFTLRDPYLRLLDGAGNVLATDDDISGSNWGSQISDYLATSTDTYYLEASSSPIDGTYTTGTYRVDASAGAPAASGSFDFSNVSLGSNAIANSTPALDTISLPNASAGNYPTVLSDTSSAIPAAALIGVDTAHSIR